MTSNQMTMPTTLKSGHISTAPKGEPVFLVYPDGRQTPSPVILSLLEFEHGAIGWVEPLILETISNE